MPKALFLDRDGIINQDHGYVFKSSDFQFVDGVFELCRRFSKAGFKIIVVTNQSGIGRGFYTEQDFHELTDWMKAQFFNQNVVIDDVYFCPHHPLKGLGKYKTHCQCRKPQPGMLLQAKAKLSLAMEDSVIMVTKYLICKQDRKLV